MAFIGYQIYVGANKIRNNAEQRMAKHNSKQFRLSPCSTPSP